MLRYLRAAKGRPYSLAESQKRSARSKISAPSGGADLGAALVFWRAEVPDISSLNWFFQWKVEELELLSAVPEAWDSTRKSNRLVIQEMRAAERGSEPHPD